MSSARLYFVKPGNLSTLSIQTADIRSPEPGEICIKIRAIGLNFADVFAILGLYKAAPKEPFVPGLEYAGEVIAIGNAVTHFKPGDRVMGISRFGAYADHITIDARYVVHCPDHWDFATGAAYLVQTLTAYYGLVRLGALEARSAVLIHSAVGGVGLQALKIVKAYNGFAIGSIGSQAKVDMAYRAGYDAVIVRGKNFESELLEALDGKPLQLVMDSIGGKYFSIPFKHLAPMGRMVVFGAARYSSPGDKPNYLRLLYYFLKRPKIDPQMLPEKKPGRSRF